MVIFGARHLSKQTVTHPIPDKNRFCVPCCHRNGPTKYDVLLFKYHSAYLVAVYYLIIFINEPVPHGVQEFANNDILQNACVICVTKPSLAYLCTPNQKTGQFGFNPNHMT